MKIQVLTVFLFFSVGAQASSAPVVKSEFFIDTYYSYDSNRPNDKERQFTTQPARHNEMNINMAYASFSAEGEKTHGKLTLQHGTSVVKNYSSEPTRGSTSGPLDSRVLQEAFGGFKWGDKTWVDAGIYLGHIGMESWISKYNWTYTRTMMLDYVPYYQTGIRISQKLNDQHTVQLHILNGWQNISESNQDKAVGVTYIYDDSVHSFSYNNFMGKTAPATSTRATLRTYHNFNASHQWEHFGIKSSFDFGTQDNEVKSGTKTWSILAIVLRYKFDQQNSLALRNEYFNDPKQVVALTQTAHGFKTYSTSANFDHAFDLHSLLRFEYRYYVSKDAIFPSHNGTAKNEQIITSSLAYTF